MGKGPLIIFSGPAGSGKTTLVKRLLTQDWPLAVSVSVTTRAPRSGEKDGVDYHFWSPTRFDRELNKGGFLEWAEVFGERYGTLQREVDKKRKKGLGVLLTIDVQGWKQVKQKCPEAVSIFLRTSSLETYEKRLRGRGTEDEAALNRRLQGARKELALADQYDYQVVNDDLEKAVVELSTIVRGILERTNHVG